jgi:Subtilase family
MIYSRLDKRFKDQKGRGLSHRFAPALLSMLLLLPGCGVTHISTDQNTSYPYVLTLKVSAADSVAALESKYAGKVQVFHPDAGFAVLGVHNAPASNIAVLGFEANNGTIELPESNSRILPRVMNSEAWSSWGSGLSFWGGSWSSWGSAWSTWGSGSSTTSLPTMPNENRFSWNLIRLNSAQAVSKNFGVGAKIAVIDSGIDLTHSAFTGRLAPSTEWKDFVDGDSDPQEVSGGNGYGHGTFVSSLILQVAPQATILPIRVLAADGSGSETAVISGIDWAIQKGAQIINLSLGASTDNVALEAEIDYATSRGIYVVVSAGNDSSNTLTYPAQRAKTAPNEKYLISVGSTASSSVLSIFCNINPALEITAPGELVYAALPGGAAGFGSGTSFAAPQVSGLLALTMMDTATTNRGNLQTYLLNGSVGILGGYKMVDMVSTLRQMPDFKVKKALMVVGSTTLNAGDAAVKTRLEGLGYIVTLKTGTASLASDANNKDLVVITSTISSTDVNTKFRNVTAPVIVWESSLFDDMGMVDLQANTGLYSAENNINVTGTHPLTAGLLTGTYAAYSSPDIVHWGKPAASAIKIATLSSNSSLTTNFAYDKGTQMVGMTAPGRRIALMLGDNGASKINLAGSFLFNAAITWAVSGN